MKNSIKVFKKAFREPKVYGNLIGDASLASIVNLLILVPMVLYGLYKIANLSNIDKSHKHSH